MFQQVHLISLKRRPDRLDNFRQLQKDNGWRLPEPAIFPAIDGNKVGVPLTFTEGGGAWGCCRSHVNILERCLMDDVESVLMLEDDVTWTPDAWDELENFMKKVPQDWDMLMLGGQHISRPKVNQGDGFVRCVNTQRTHAYAIRGRAMKSLLELWYSTTFHVDWAFNGWQQNWKVYAPEPSFIFGQAAGRSDISGNTNPVQTWSGHKEPKSKTHIVVLRSPRNVIDNIPTLHRGYWLHSSGIDNGLLELLTADDRAGKLKEWATVITTEATRGGSIPCVWCEWVTTEEVRAAAPGREVVEIEAATLTEFHEKWRQLDGR